MIKLLNAGFARVGKSKLFYLLMLFSAGLALIMIFEMYREMKTYEDTIEVGQLMLNYATIVGIVIATFTSLFLGAEYSDGTVRNKIGVGHKRSNIYLSNLVVTASTSLLSYILFLVVVACIGIPIFGFIKMPISELLAMLGCIFIAILAYSAVFTFIAMIISNKAITAIVSILLAFGFMMAAMTCLNTLMEPEFYEYPSVTYGGTGAAEILREPNPNYPSEAEREAYQTLLDINPAGQMFQLAGRTEPNLNVLPLYSLGILIVFTAAGIVLFNKKDIK